MKQFFVIFGISILFFATGRAGEVNFSSKEAIATQPSPCWYADREWQVSLWGTYVFTGNDYPTLGNSNPFLVVPEHDTFIEADHAWGGGVNANYFFARYFGIGVEGYVLDVRQSYPDVFINFGNVGGGTNFARTSHDQRVIGSVLGTFTLRYPIGCSRFAPYLFAGGGAIIGGGQTSVFDTTTLGDIEFTRRSGSTTKAIGQFGGGVEVRLTSHIGLINDFTWNIIDGRNNNFGMTRTGLTFAF
jgi:hypothetical protein